MKKIVEMTYCDRCSTAIAPEEFESYEGFDLCRPCATELRRRICIFVSELKVPEQPEVEATIEPVKPPSAEAIPEPELESSPQREPEQVELSASQVFRLRCYQDLLREEAHERVPLLRLRHGYSSREQHDAGVCQL